MARGIGNNKFSFGGGKIAIGDINRNTLFAFGLQTIKKQGIIDLAADTADPLAVPFQS